ncbi:MAG: tRNA (adenosine(37)-N6)-threonylcarbamoyltransferase complex dimerization subunit type 1 TsaB [Pseudomonadales bacterium]|nr:tRNA (adenosine(37)-N6)-threonylcarbamoyltransferase complex dimerization subunit type 1 TsaB [Pseudomonadales bacterium]
MLGSLTLPSNVLALDTSGPACSLALSTEGRVLERHETGARIHNERLLALLDELFKEAALSPRALDCLVLSVGPGAFTGLRIGTSAAQAMAFAAGAPVLCISSLEALALTHQAALVAEGLDAVEVLVDARMGELYRATFVLDESGLAYEDEDEITTVESLTEAPALSSQWGLIGDGQDLPALAPRGAEAGFRESSNIVRARALLPLVAQREPGAPEKAVPRYLEGRVRWQPAAAPGIPVPSA